MKAKRGFEAVFSPLRASPDTVTEVIRKMHQEKKANRRFIRRAVLAAAAVLLLAATVFAASVIRASLRPAESVKAPVLSAYGSGDISTKAAVIHDANGNPLRLPEMVRRETDAESVSGLVGSWLYDVEGSLTDGDYTVRAESFLVDEQGMGVLTCCLENPNGIECRDAGYGQADLPVQLEVLSGADKFMDSHPYLIGKESTDSCLSLAVYFGSFEEYHPGDPVFLGLRAGAEWQLLELRPEACVPAETLSAEGSSVTLSPLGITVENPSEHELVVRELILTFRDGSDYAVVSEERDQYNTLCSYWQAGDGSFRKLGFVFNRLVDTEEVAAVTVKGIARDETVALTFGR